MEDKVTGTGDTLFVGLDGEVWSSLAAAVLLRQRMEPGGFLPWLSGELYNLEQSTFVKWVPRVHPCPMPVCYSTVMGRLGQKSRSHVGIHCRMWRRGTEWLLSSIVYYENIFSNRNSCEPGFPGLIGVEECAPSAAFYWCCLHIYFGLAQI